MTWNEAENWCLNEYGVHLVSIHNDDENTASQSACGLINDCWIGARRNENQSDFVWSDGTGFDLNVENASIWDQRYFNDSNVTNSYCVVLADYEWIETECDELYRPLCAGSALGILPKNYMNSVCVDMFCFFVF